AITSATRSPSGIAHTPTTTAAMPATATHTLSATASVTPTASPTATATRLPTFAYGVPLDPLSPWPKFRRNAAQDGRSPVQPHDSASAAWTFHTEKGVFSTPVIDGEGNVYIGSADHVFYALDARGNERWRFRTGEIIDSSALLD